VTEQTLLDWVATALLVMTLAAIGCMFLARC